MRASFREVQIFDLHLFTVVIVGFTRVGTFEAFAFPSRPYSTDFSMNLFGHKIHIAFRILVFDSVFVNVKHNKVSDVQSAYSHFFF